MVEISIDDCLSVQQEEPKSKSDAKDDHKKSTVRLKEIKNIDKRKVPYQGEVFFKKPFQTTVSCFKALERVTLSYKDLRV